MFFAYNNGLTTTAENVQIGTSKDGIPCIKKLSNFQIVNGGQTTASMYYASNRAKSDLSKVFVQMKLSVVNPDVLDEVVSNISRYANTQNKVSNADFLQIILFTDFLRGIAMKTRRQEKRVQLYQGTGFMRELLARIRIKRCIQLLVKEKLSKKNILRTR